MSTKPKKVLWNGKIYPSINSLAVEQNGSTGALRNCIQRGVYRGKPVSMIRYGDHSQTK